MERRFGGPRGAHDEEEGAWTLGEHPGGRNGGENRW